MVALVVENQDWNGLMIVKWEQHQTMQRNELILKQYKKKKFFWTNLFDKFVMFIKKYIKSLFKINQKFSIASVKIHSYL